MQCDNCGVNINAEFQFAISSNNCPGCGKNIMKAEKLINFLNLKTLISNNFIDIDSERLVNLIIANFELKQLFKEERIEKINKDVEVKKQGDQIEVKEAESMEDLKKSDELHKLRQMADAKETLKKLRDEAYEGALRGAWGMEDETTNDPAVVVDMANKIERAQSQENILTGSKGAFTRSQ